MSLFDLKGRVALVTGGNGGIGLGMARGMAEAGAAIAVAGRNVAKSEAAAAELAKLGVKTAVIEVDVASEASCRKMIDDTVKRLGRLDILVNNAGINIRKAAAGADGRGMAPGDRHQPHQRLHLLARRLPAHEEGRRRQDHQHRLDAVDLRRLLRPAYGASKGGVVQLTKALAVAWAKDNIQVNAVLPGWIDTDLTRSAREQVSGLNAMVLMRTPAKRWGKPEDHRRRRRVPGEHGLAISSPAPPSRWTAAIRCRSRRFPAAAGLDLGSIAFPWPFPRPLPRWPPHALANSAAKARRRRGRASATSLQRKGPVL